MKTQVYLDEKGVLCCSKHKEKLWWYLKEDKYSKKLTDKLIQCFSCFEENEQKQKKNKTLKKE